MVIQLKKINHWLGKRHSEESRGKMSESHRGRKVSAETRIKIGRMLKGRELSEDHKKKISEAKKGIPHFNQRGKNHYKWKGGIIKHSRGYILIYNRKHLFASKRDKYILRARLIAEKRLNRYLEPKEVMHHINGIKDDDRPKNLYLFPSNRKHLQYDNLKNKPTLQSNLL